MTNLKYELYVKGMKCSNCAHKVESLLKEFEGVISADVNLITEKALIIINNKKLLEDIKSTLDEMNFSVTHMKDLNKIDNKNRIMTYEIQNTKDFDKARIKNIKGVEKIKTKFEEYSVNKKNKNGALIIEYDPEVIKGHNLHEKIIKQDTNSNLQYINAYSDSIKITDNYKFSLCMKKLIILIILTISMMFLTMVNSTIHKFLQSIQFFTQKINLFLIISLSISAFIIFYFGISIYKRSYYLYKKYKLLNMETLITLGSVASIFYTFHQFLRLIFANESDINKCVMMCVHAAEAASLVLSITIIGKYIEERAKNNIKKYTNSIMNKMSFNQGNCVTWIKPRNRNFLALEEKTIDVGLLEKDEFAVVKEKDIILFDGVIVHGEVEIKENTTFGYEVVYKKKKGDKIKSGSQIKSGECVVMVEEVLEESILFKLIKEMNSSLNQKLRFQNFVDNIMIHFVPLIIILSILTFIIWLLYYIYIYSIFLDENKDYEYLTFSFVVERGISILVVSCPCAFGLAIPTVTTIVLNLALKNGMLIKNLSALPEVRNANCIVFDKTGTLTEILRDIKVEYMSNEFIINDFPIFETIAQIEKNQNHPIAEVLYAYCLKNTKATNSLHNIVLTQPVQVNSNGVQGVIKFNEMDYVIHIGNYNFMSLNEIDLKNEENLSVVYTESITRNLNVCFVAVNKIIKLIFTIDSSSNIRKEAAYVISYLKNSLEKKTFILSGDHDIAVKDVGRRLGIDEENCFGDADNQMKREYLNYLKHENKVIMIGDGVNDILSLSEADYGISFNATSQLNLIAGDVIFVRQDLRLILSLIKISKLTYIFMWINIFWACAYNLCMLPISSGFFHFLWKMDMTPVSSSFSMLCSSLLIILTSYSLTLFSLKFDESNSNKNENDLYANKVNSHDSNLIINEQVVITDSYQMKNNNDY